jgi:NTP pyrophosphatase (non-canonical NTP hydrolase)
LRTFEEYDMFVEGMKRYDRKHSTVYPALGLAGEAGEIAEKVKKWLRDEGGGVISEDRREAILAELGDPLWYITALASDLGYTLQDVVDVNVQKLTSRRERGVIHGSGDNR